MSKVMKPQQHVSLRSLTPEQVQEAVSHLLNRMDGSGQMKAFLDAVENDHRTLQQLFTRLCLMWLERVDNEDYGTDGRNEASKSIAKDLLDAWQNENGDRTPSQWLPFI